MIGRVKITRVGGYDPAHPQKTRDPSLEPRTKRRKAKHSSPAERAGHALALRVLAAAKRRDTDGGPFPEDDHALLCEEFDELVSLAQKVLARKAT